jgi:hypothetical protein
LLQPRTPEDGLDPAEKKRRAQELERLAAERDSFVYGRPHLKVMPSLLATGDMGVGLNANDYYRSVNVCEACFHKYENIDQFRERVHYMLMEDIQRESDRKAKEDEAKARHLRDKTAKHCILNAWCVLGIGHSGACSDKEPC